VNGEKQRRFFYAATITFRALPGCDTSLGKCSRKSWTAGKTRIDRGRDQR